MKWEHASLIVALASLGAAIWLVLRAGGLQRQALKKVLDLEAGLNDSAATLQSLLVSARRESERLEAVIRRVEGLSISTRRDALRAIEELADPAALSESQQLADLAEQLWVSARSRDADLFGENSTAVRVAHLADQGHPPPYIAERLGLSLGDVELLLSLRSA